MTLFYICVLGVALFGGAFVKFSIAGIQIFYLVLLFLVVAYIKYFYSHWGVIQLTKINKAIIGFELYALMMIAMSFAGTNKLFASDDLFFEKAYIPRQAYYVFVIPAILLMEDRDNIDYFKNFLNKNYNIIFWIIYIGSMIYSKRFAISVPTELILAGLLLWGNDIRRTKSGLLQTLLILFSPIAVGGEMTNMLIRMIYAFLYFYKNKRNAIKIFGLAFKIMIAGIFILPIMSGLFTNIFDANSWWRLLYWKDELAQLVQSYGLGVGYGTSYATENFVGNLGSVVSGPFAATAEYSTLDKLFITGPHNSYVSIAFRLGIVGIVLFLVMIFDLIEKISEKNNEISRCAIFMLFSSIVLIGVNVGLESPYYLIMFVFSFGFCASEVYHEHE